MAFQGKSDTMDIILRRPIQAGGFPVASCALLLLRWVKKPVLVLEAQPVI